MASKFKLVFTVPKDHADAVRKAIGEAGAGSLGNYSFCSFSVSGIGRFKPENGANPTIGQIGQMTEIEEERVECQCHSDVIGEVMAALKQSHPYEEIAYDLYPVVTWE